MKKSYTIVHSLDGYDEVSLTGKVKLISNGSEIISTPDQLTFESVTPGQISGGKSIADAAEIFMDVLNGDGSRAQKQVVLANASLAIQTAKSIDFAAAKALAQESLDSGAASHSFSTLINLN